ncbi:AI-2E family transporter [Agromyces sp. G08B096]|uniref:AI-2E family transporter n=1 Tax=Agromyces sp. G08B096 TaxID=3156399 RepID=A0AAU7W736_9MICO
MGLGGATVAAFGLSAIGSIFVPTFFALVLTICAQPIRRGLERRGIPRGLATGSVILATTLLLLGFGAALSIAVAQFATLLPQYAPELQDWVAGIGDWLSSLGIGEEQVQHILSGFDPTALVGFLSGLLGNATSLLAAFVVLLTMLILMAMDSGYGPTLLGQLRPRKPALVAAVTRFTSGVRRYMVVTTLLGVAQGLVNWIALVILGVPGALLWGLLAFLCSFIPNIGYFIALIPPLIFGGLVGGWPTVIAVIVVYGIINAVIQSIIQPKVVGNAVALSQTLTFFSVLFWAVVLGPMGAILAIPLSLLVRMLFVDSNPQVAWMLPAIGELDETKRIMDDEDAAAKEERQRRRHPSP